MNKTGIERAIDAAGSQEKLAALLSCSQQYISNCKFRGYISTEKAMEIEDQFNISRFDLIHPNIAMALKDND